MTFIDNTQTAFSVGTEQLAGEWVATVNYWAARRTKPPLVGGGVGGGLAFDFGWGDPSQMEDDSVDTRSVRSRTISGAGIRIAEWKNPTLEAATRAKDPNNPNIVSELAEEAQLVSLRTYKDHLTHDLAEHRQMQANLVSGYLSLSLSHSLALDQC